MSFPVSVNMCKLLIGALRASLPSPPFKVAFGHRDLADKEETEVTAEWQGNILIAQEGHSTVEPVRSQAFTWWNEVVLAASNSLNLTHLRSTEHGARSVTRGEWSCV